MKSIMSRAAESAEQAVRKHLAGITPDPTRPQSARSGLRRSSAGHARNASRSDAGGPASVFGNYCSLASFDFRHGCR
jgi:hypothetical protein